MAAAKISVVIPCYNHESYIEQAIDSVLGQDWPDIDLIIIDDGSSDKSAAVVAEYRNKNPDFRFVTRENRGIIRTLNEGIEMAGGDYFCLLASDDYLRKESLRSRAEYLNAHPDRVAVLADAVIVDGVTETDEHIMTDERRGVFTDADPIALLLKGLHLPIHPFMIRLDALRRIGGFDERYLRCEDLDLQLRLFLDGRVDFLNTSVYCYRKHQSNASRLNRQMARADKVLCYRKYLEEIAELKPYRKMIRRRLCRQYLRLGRYLKHSGGGTERERLIFQGGWEFAWRDVRLLWHLASTRRRD